MGLKNQGSIDTEGAKRSFRPLRIFLKVPAIFANFFQCISIVSLFGLVKSQFIMVKLGPTYSLRLGSACWTGTSIGTHNWDPVWCRDGRPEGAALRVLRHSEGFHDRLEALYQSLAQKGGISTNKKWGDAAPRLI